MQIQNIGFTGKTNSRNTRYNYRKMNNSTYRLPNQDSKLKKTIIVLGAIAAAGVGIGVIVKNKSTKPIQEAVNTAVQKNSDSIQKAEIDPKSAETLANNIADDGLTQSANSKVIKTMAEAKAEFQERVSKAQSEFEARLDSGTGFFERIKQVQGADNPKNISAKSSKIRMLQLKTLAREQFTALDDRTLDRLVYCNNGSTDKLKNMRLLKSLSPEQIIKAQSDEQGRKILFDILENETNGYALDTMMLYLNRL